jgi:hypothetical protein
MKRVNTPTAKQRYWVSPIFVILFALFSVSGCFSYTALEVDPENAAAELQVGDRVRITDKEDNHPLIEIDSISHLELTGQLQNGLFKANEEITVKLDEIEAITLFQPPTVESELPYVIVGVILGLIVADIILEDLGTGVL